MKDQDLVRMANQIAGFFDSYPREKAVAGVADHILNFWDPRMRAQYIAYVKSNGADLSDSARMAAALLN